MLELLARICEEWNERPDRLTPEWKDKFTNLVNAGGKIAATKIITKDPRRQEPI